MSQKIPAGHFSTWLAQTNAVLIAGAEAGVPCGTCNACCKSGQFIEVTPTDQAARARIPQELLFPAPGKPGHWVMGFNEQGHCPMLEEEVCTIYAARPATCRAYDCRIFAAADISAGEGARAAVSARARSWAFTYESATDSERAQAIKAAAAYLTENPQPGLSENPIQLALAAIRIHDLFLPSAVASGPPAAAAIRAILQP